MRAVSGSGGCVWRLSASEAMAVVAYVCDGGLVGLMPLEPPDGEARHRKSHAALSAMAVAEGQLWMLGPRDIPGNGGLYVAGVWGVRGVRGVCVWGGGGGRMAHARYGVSAAGGQLRSRSSGVSND